ncbi:MAG: hypothetical protein KJ824_13590, partial [Alphaproteobacteria bacterium]|nr:hypothetical protein [Alphaproteobacteria bacterium]
AGLLRWLMAAQTGLLPPQPITAQINRGLSLWLDEKRGSRHFVSDARYRLGVGVPIDWERVHSALNFAL